MKKGFTLIELLIVITIIGILAVAFLPTILGAPVKGRDTQRIADLQKIQKVLISFALENGGLYPDTGDFFETDRFTRLAAPNNTFGKAFGADFGGQLPVSPDPQPNLNYIYYNGAWMRANGWTNANYTFVLRTGVELFENANASCNYIRYDTILDPPDPSDPTTWCYGIIVN